MITTVYMKHAKGLDEGDNAHVKRLFPIEDQESYNPFVLIDEFFIPANAGFPKHGHRGFEAYTYVVEGALEHSDSSGHHQVIEAGGVQHFIAGKGISHSELPASIKPICHGFQIWVNLPSDMKQHEPLYDFWQSDQIPLTQNKGSETRHIVGDGSPVVSTLPLIIQDITIEINAHHFASIPEEMEGLLYCYSGKIESCNYHVGSGDYFFLPESQEILIYAVTKSRLLLAAGVPLAQPIRISGSSVE